MRTWLRVAFWEGVEEKHRWEVEGRRRVGWKRVVCWVVVICFALREERVRRRRAWRRVDEGVGGMVGASCDSCRIDVLIFRFELQFSRLTRVGDASTDNGMV